MDRRSFLKLPALLPLVEWGRTFGGEDHHFAHECVMGTSLDLIVRSPSASVAQRALETVCTEIDRLARVLDTRDPTSEISLMERSDSVRGISPVLADVLSAYEFWERRTSG